MVYNTQNHWVFELCCPEFQVNRKDNLSETGVVSFSSEGRETPILLGSLERAILNH
jgi:hypothetical protein